IIAHEQATGVEAVRRNPPTLTLPQPNGSAGTHFVRNEAERRDGIAVSASLGPAWSGIIFGVDTPNFPERQLAPVTIGRHRRRSPLAEHRTDLRQCGGS